jgi:hypothetical protein
MLKRLMQTLLLAGVIAIARDASASEVDNYGDYTLQFTSGSGLYYTTFYFPADGGGLQSFSHNDGELFGSIASNGALSGISVTGSYSPAAISPTFTMNNATLNGKLVIDAANSSGAFDIRSAAMYVSLTFRVRVKFTGGGISATCQTPAFNITISTTKTFSKAGTTIPGVSYSASDGSFKVVASDFCVPALTTGCDTQTNRDTINGQFGLNDGYSCHTAGLVVRGKVDDPAILYGSP